MLSDTTYLGFRPLFLYFLPQLPNFHTSNTFMSYQHWLTSSTPTPLIILCKTPLEARVKKISVAFFQIVPLLYWIFMSNTNKSHSKLNTSLSFRDSRIAVKSSVLSSCGTLWWTLAAHIVKDMAQTLLKILDYPHCCHILILRHSRSITGDDIFSCIPPTGL